MKSTKEPVWGGPDVDGITFSLLSRFLVCPERFRLKVVEGLVEDIGFNVSIEYGNLWHEAEEAHHKGKPWDLAVKKHRTKLLAQHPGSEAEIHKWASICLKQFPIYLQHWSTNHLEQGRISLFQEQSFKLPYTLPSGRTLFLRGKIDEGGLLPLHPPKNASPRDARNAEANKNHRPQTTKRNHQTEQQEYGLYIQENKTKGQIDTEGLLGTVAQNLQTMFYQTAVRLARRPARATGQSADYYSFGDPFRLVTVPSEYGSPPVTGTIYNVIRRPLGDRFAIKQKSGRLDKKTGKRIGAESNAQFMQRVEDTIRENQDEYFFRLKVDLLDEDMEQFKTRVFHPILERLLDWWEWIKVDPFDPWHPRKAFGELTFAPCRLTKSNLPTTTEDLINEKSSLTAANCLHYQAPWGVYNSMFGGFRGDYFDYLTRGSEIGLVRTDNLFPEL